MGNFIDLTGKKVFDIRFIERVRRPGDRRTLWRCRCERLKPDGTQCGNLFVVAASDVHCGRTHSCGCFRESIKRHRSPLENWIYARYYSMLGRCYDKNNPSYYAYGGRGIGVCELWRNDREAFITFCRQHGYRPGLQIDRIDTNGDYGPDNVRFVTCRENNNNKRNTRFVELDGELIPVSVMADQMCIARNTAWAWVKNGTAQQKLRAFRNGTWIRSKCFKHKANA